MYKNISVFVLLASEKKKYIFSPRIPPPPISSTSGLFEAILAHAISDSPTLPLDQGLSIELSKFGVIRNLEFDRVTSFVFHILQNKLGESIH